MLIFSVIGSIALTTLSFMNFTEHNAFMAAICMFFVICEVAFVDLLCEGKYTELMIINSEQYGNEKSNSDIVT